MIRLLISPHFLIFYWIFFIIGIFFLHKQQVASFKKATMQLNPNIPLILLPGNSDLQNEPTKENLMVYRHRFGDDYYSFWLISLSLSLFFFWKENSSLKKRKKKEEKMTFF